MKIKKESVFALVLWMLLGAGMGIVSVIIAKEKALSWLDNEALSMALMLLCMVGAILVQLIAHEGGHLLFGLLTGYRFVSFRIFSLALVKLEGSLHVKRLSLPGTAGQCLMAPPEPYTPHMPTQLYNYGGVLMNLLLAVLALPLILFGSGAVALFSAWVAGVGILFALLNGVPMRVMVSNDGLNARNMRKHSANVWALWVQLKVQQELTEGKRLKDLPEEWFKPEAPLQNDLIWAQEIMGVQQLLDKGEYEKALTTGMELLPRLGESPLLGFQVRGDMIFLHLLLGQADKAQRLMDKNYQKLHKKMAAMVKTLPSMIRTEYAKALLLEKDKEKAAELKECFDKSAAHYPYPSEITGEREMMTAVEQVAAQTV